MNTNFIFMAVFKQKLAQMKVSGCKLEMMHKIENWLDKNEDRLFKMYSSQHCIHTLLKTIKIDKSNPVSKQKMADTLYQKQQFRLFLLKKTETILDDLTIRKRFKAIKKLKTMTDKNNSFLSKKF